MDTQVFDLVKNPDEWDSAKEWKYERPGYNFVGYKIENDGETFKNPQDFKEYL